MEDALFLAALKFLSYRPRSEKEIKDYLKKKLKMYPRIDTSQQQIIDSIIQKLKNQKFLNDEEFAKMWVRSRTEFKPKGWRLISLELKQKGISDEIIKNIELTIKNQEGQRNELGLAKEILERKRAKYEAMDRQGRFNKAGSFLARRGFNLDTIKSAIDQVFGK